MVCWNVSVVLSSDELKKGLEAVLEASLGGVVAAHPTSDPPHLVVLVGPRDLELDHVGGGVGGRGQPAGLQSGGQADGLHRGAHLAPDPDGQVDLGVLVGIEEVSAADHGQHLAGSRLEDHNGGVRMPPPSRNVALHRLLGGLLEVQVDGGLDAQTTLEEQPLPDPATGTEGRVVQEPAPDLFHKMPSRITGLETGRVLLKMGGRGHGSCVLLFGDEFVGQHPVQHQVAALEALGNEVKTIEMKAIPIMKYDVNSFSVKPGQPVRIILNNEESMPHNVVIVEPGSFPDRIIEDLAILYGSADASGLDYIPQTDTVLFHTAMINVDESTELLFFAPESEGVYPYLCTYPGHWGTMNGVMEVKD